MIGESTMKKKIISILIVVVVITVSFLYAHIDKNNYLYDRNADTSKFHNTGILAEGEEIRQTFVAEEESIDGINVKVAMSGNIEDVVLKYTLLDENSEKLFAGVVPANELENNKFNKLAMSEITRTKGKHYTLILSEENSDEQNGISFYVEPAKQGERKLIIKGTEDGGTLVARVISHQFDMETFCVLLGMIAFVAAFMKILYKFFK